MTSRTVIVRVAGLGCVLAFAIGVGAGSRQATPVTSSPAQTPAEHAMGTRMKAKGIPNFGQVTPILYRGAQPSQEGLEALKKRDVNLVIDLRGGGNKDEETAVVKLGMQYVSIPSHCPFPKDEPFAKFLRVIRENPGKKVFVHCRLGDDRTGMAVAAYRMADEGWSADEAMKEMKAFGFSAVHRAMCPGLADYEENFPQRLKTSTAFKELQPYGTSPEAK
jgi:tyrosine-protein phosphatase SIW14